MGIPSDPSFGADFSSAEFTQAITSTMEMGMASGAHTPTFFWNEVAEYANGASTSNTPYDLTAEPDTIIQAAKTLVVPVSVEFGEASTNNFTSLGELNKAIAKLTLLEEYYDQIKTADGVTLSGVDYTFDFTEPVVGLFDVNVFTIHCSPVDEAMA